MGFPGKLTFFQDIPITTGDWIVFIYLLHIFGYVRKFGLILLGCRLAYRSIIHCEKPIRVKEFAHKLKLSAFGNDISKRYFYPLNFGTITVKI